MGELDELTALTKQNLHMDELTGKLTRRIQERLRTYKFCTIFESDLSRIWPYEQKEREKRKKAIKAYAKAHNWSATILDHGVRLTFRKLRS